MIGAISAGTDIYGDAAVRLFGLTCNANDVETQFPKERKKAKETVLGLLNGQTAYGLALKLRVKQPEARKLQKQLLRSYPGIEPFFDRIERELQRNRFVSDMFGRRRDFAELEMTSEGIDVSASDVWAAVVREARNAVIQGAAATITKLGMIRCHRRIQEQYQNVKLVLALHDELQFEVPDDDVEAFARELPDLMCKLGLRDRFGFSVPLEVTVKVGSNMGELQPWKGVGQ